MASMAGILARPWNIIDAIGSTSTTPEPSEIQTLSISSPQHTKVPSIAANEAATTAAQELVATLSNPKTNTAWEKISNQQLDALRSLAKMFQDTTARNKPGYETSKHPAKLRVEATNPRVSNSLPPLQTQPPTPEHQYPTRSTRAANLLSGINHKNWQEVVPTQPTGNNIQLANTIVDNNTSGALEY